jgi:uncharacterized phiE125 gp8 family phage protein
MPFGLKPITPPSVEPVTVDTALRARLRLDGTDDDADIGAMLAAARELVEAETHRSLITQTWSLFLDMFPYQNMEIRVPRAPLQSVTWIKYYDLDGTLQTLDPSLYHVATAREPGAIWPVFNFIWPFTQYSRPESVEIRFVAGYGNAASNVPNAALEAIKVLVADRYTHRGDDSQTPIPPAARRLLNTLEYGENW